MFPSLPSSRSSRTRPLSSAAAGALGVALAVASGVVGSGCATAPKQPALRPVVWPLAPDKPRVRYVRTLRSGDDLGARSAWKAFTEGFSPPAREDAVSLPTGLALSPDETRLVVACGPAHRVVEFNFAKGNARLIANEEGLAPTVPFAAAFDASGALYVSDSGTGAVFVYGPNGAFQRQIGKRLLVRPTGLAIDRKRQILYVVDVPQSEQVRHVVEVFSLSGEHLRTMGRRGNGPGEFNFPSHLAVAPDGNLYVSDTLNFRVQVFDPNGDLVTMFGSQGDTLGMFGKIKGIGFDTLGNAHIVDSEPAVVTIFDSKQQFLMFYGGRARRVEYLMSPGAIVIDSKNNIFIGDYQNSIVQQYVLFDTSPPDAVTPAAGPGPAAPAAPAAPDAVAPAPVAPSPGTK